MHKNHFGLALGSLFALLHAVWLLAVAVIPEPLYNFIHWVLTLHHVDFSFNILPFSLTKAVILVAMTFVFGYIIGWLFMAFLACCKKHCKGKCCSQEGCRCGK